MSKRQRILQIVICAEIAVILFMVPTVVGKIAHWWLV
jgi:hypothetical protein